MKDKSNLTYMICNSCHSQMHFYFFYCLKTRDLMWTIFNFLNFQQGGANKDRENV